MKNKGFTLIELLAVLIILAIISLIAVPNILNLINNTEVKSKQINIDNMMHLAEIYYTDEKVNNNNVKGNLYNFIEDQINGAKPESAIIYRSSNGNYAYAIKMDGICYTKEYLGDEKSTKTEECIVPIDYLPSASQTNDATETFFNGTLRKEQIEKIIAVDSSEVPSDVLGSWNILENGNIKAWYYDNDGDNLYELYIGQEGGVKATPDSTKLFNYFINVTELDLRNFDTSSITKAKAMFQYCENLIRIIGINTFDTSNIDDMSFMFAYCSSLETLNVSNFDTSKVTNMMNMFGGCSSLTTLDVSNFDTTNVTNMSFMFSSSSNNPMQLQYIKGIENFNTINVTTMRTMFQYCVNLKSLNLSKWNTENVTNMAYMFNNASDLIMINLSGFNTNNVTNMTQMFGGTTNLSCIQVGSGWTTNDATTTDMFINSGVSSVQTDNCSV